MSTLQEQAMEFRTAFRKFVFEVLKELKIDKLVEWLNDKLTNRKTNNGG